LLKEHVNTTLIVLVLQPINSLSWIVSVNQCLILADRLPYSVHKVTRLSWNPPVSLSHKSLALERWQDTNPSHFNPN